MKSRYISPIFIIFTIIVFASSIVSATIAVRMSIEKLVNLSTHIVLGEVIEITSEWNEQHTMIKTKMIFNVEKQIKGNIHNIIIAVELPGGTVGDVSTNVVGGPSFNVGEKAVLFLRKKTVASPVDTNQFQMSDLTQGKFRIKLDQERGAEIAVSEVIGKLHLLPDESGVTTPPGGEDGIPIDEFIDQIQAID